MSAVKPLGPGVVPRRALRRFVVSKAGGSWIGDAGSQVSKSGGTMWHWFVWLLGPCGRVGELVQRVCGAIR